MFKTGQEVTISLYEGQDTDTESRVLVGTEQAEVIGIVDRYDASAMVWVRPFNSDDQIQVHIKDMKAVA